ncbi:hypothetical protein PsorP6_011787 [Peronosclerospora sorghi]|uniref:Uncharacterized protein n=1 Tax=Peronosclerospora sorghi TaxID=230839 RepID=A0ACC0WIH1_9STRA|nr:hypothetical protein PsorP6_011787 [Peronosclerospora sorghi]
MSRSTTVARSRNGRAGADGPVASESETLVQRAIPSIKRYNIARFDLSELPHFSSCAQTVMMYRDPERVDDEEEKEEDVSVGYNPSLRKRRRLRRRDTRTSGWVIEESEGYNKFNGTFEFGQSSTYMLLVKNRHNDEFSVMPVEHYRTLTLEEAEEMNNEKKPAVERWLMKHKLVGEDKADAFGETTARPRRVPRPKSRGEGATGEDGGDIEEKFDDDESDAEIHHDEPQGPESDSDEDEFEVDPEGTGKLTETGQAMKDLLLLLLLLLL